MTHAKNLRSIEFRLAALKVFDAAKASGKTNRQAVALSGISNPTAWRYRQKFAAGGPDALVSKSSSGRRSLFDRIGLLPATLEVLQEHRVSLACHSPRHAIRLAMQDRRCPADQRRRLAPYARAQRALPNAFAQLLKLKRAPRIELHCGRFSRLLKSKA